MIQRDSRASGLRLLLGALLCLLFGGPSFAAGLELEGRLGLGGRATFGDHAAVNLRLRLPEGEPAFRGRLRVGVSGLQLSGTELSVVLAPGGERHVRLAIPYVRGSVHQALLVEDAGGAGRSVEVELEDDTQRIDGQSIVLLGSEGWPALVGDVKVALVHVAPEELPRDARVLKGLGALVVPLRADLRDHLADPALAETLRDYAESGGVVVFCARPDTPRVWVGGPLEPLLPVRNPRAAAARPSQVATFLGGIEVRSLPCVRADLAPGARWRERNEGLGLMAELDLGAGATRFLAFDPDERGPRGAVGLPSALRSATTPSAAPLSSDWERFDIESAAGFAFEGRPAMGLGGFALIVGVVVFHSLITVALAIVLRRRRRQPWLAVLVPPALSGALGTIVILLAAGGQEGPSARALVLVCQPGAQSAGPAPARAVIGLFSGRPAEVELELGAWSPIPRERGAFDSLQFRVHPPWVRVEGEARRLGPIRIPGQGHSRWLCQGEAQGLSLGLTFDEGSWEISSPEELGGQAWGVLIGAQGKVSAQALEPIGPGRAIRFDPREARPLILPERLEADPFSDPQSEAQLGQYLLGLVTARARGQKGPGFVLLHLGAREVSLPKLSSGAGESLPLEARVVTLVELETP